MTRNIDFQMRLMKKTDLSKVASMINDCYQGDLIIDYNKDYLEHSWDYGMRGIVAEKQNQIIGAIPFELASWSGWMFGKPGYDKDWERFYTIIPEEFAITPKYCDSDIPKKMASVLINIVKSNKDTVKTNGFVTDVFDQGIKWKREAYLKAGYLEPDIDLGMIVAKSLEPKIEFDKNKNWHIPTRNIVAPTK